MSSAGVAPPAAQPVSSARAEASRRNGAKSRGPKTPEGKARASQNALRHGLRAARHVVLPDEDAAAFAALEAALLEELAPVGALQAVLARQIVSAAWRLARADRIEAEILIFRQRGDADLGLAVIRDGNTARALPTLLRYRNAAHAEFLRSLRTLKALQPAASANQPAPVIEAAAVLAFEPRRRRVGTAASAPDRSAGDLGHTPPNEPEPSGGSGRSAPAAPAARRDQPPGATRARPSQPERPAAPAPAAFADIGAQPKTRLAPARGEAAAGPGAGPPVPGAIAPPRDREVSCGAQPSRSTP